MLSSRAELFDTLARLDLPTAEFAVAGSAPLLLQRLRRRIHDVDVVVRPGSWHLAARLGPSAPALFDGAREIHLADGRIHLLDRWLPSLWTPEELFASTRLVGSYRFLTLDATLKWKLHLARPQDLRDAAAIENHFTRTRERQAQRRRQPVGAPATTRIG